MGRILAIDYGRKRCGLAVTDPLKLIANGLDTVLSHLIWDFLDNYTAKEKLDAIVVGYPKNMNNTPSESAVYIDAFIKKLKQKYPEIVIELMDERFTSKLAFQAMIDGGVKKKDRQDKALVDKISAVIILQSYLDYVNKTR
ncbi:MAG: Holliday junction resolvase RuvX [Bacteroidales bacterium]|nr:Holliday junction resolvase RuvX [Bacteroidales bacterium]